MLLYVRAVGSTSAHRWPILSYQARLSSSPCQASSSHQNNNRCIFDAPPQPPSPLHTKVKWRAQRVKRKSVLWTKKSHLSRNKVKSHVRAAESGKQHKQHKQRLISPNNSRQPPQNPQNRMLHHPLQPFHPRCSPLLPKPAADPQIRRPATPKAPKDVRRPRRAAPPHPLQATSGLRPAMPLPHRRLGYGL